jgi:hypothetical protein
MNHPDVLDLEMLVKLAESRPWFMVRTRLEEILRTTKEELLTASTWERVNQLQGSVQALQMVLALPARMMREIRDKQKK